MRGAFAKEWRLTLTLQIVLVLIFAAQAVAMAVDEFHFHRRRGLERWEKWGHPLDTLTVLACFVFPQFFEISSASLVGFGLLCVFSCLFVTKDEWVHATGCPPGEQWLHAILFILHPVVLATSGLLWFLEAKGDSQAHFLRLVLIGSVTVFGLYQLIFWNFSWKHLTKQKN